MMHGGDLDVGVNLGKEFELNPQTRVSPFFRRENENQWPISRNNEVFAQR
jgi:hypothetical protein